MGSFTTKIGSFLSASWLSLPHPSPHKDALFVKPPLLSLVARINPQAPAPAKRSCPSCPFVYIQTGLPFLAFPGHASFFVPRICLISHLRAVTGTHLSARTPLAKSSSSSGPASPVSSSVKSSWSPRQGAITRQPRLEPCCPFRYHRLQWNVCAFTS